MQRAGIAVQRALAAHGRTKPACSQTPLRSYSLSRIRLRRSRRGDRHGDSQLLRSKRPSPISEASLGPGRYWLFAPGRRDQWSPKEVTTAIIQGLDKVLERIKDPEYQHFMQNTVSALNKSLESSRKAAPIVDSLRNAFLEQGPPGLLSQIKYAYHGHLASQRFSKSNLQDQARVADLRYPTEWYPLTRQMRRTIHLHVGPTNSGKTYHALRRLEKAQSGVYAGPLRLLAHEVYTRLNARGKACHLVTGDERQYAEGDDVTMSSCTVEMVPINTPFDVAVIDEIQMIGNEQRGWAWTQAVLGIRAKELHLCGEERTVPLIRELAAAMGDDLQVHHYQRLSPLKMMSSSLDNDLGKLRKGDCVVAFSIVQIHRLKRHIEVQTNKPVAVIYGSLPPEVRAQQAELFNNPDNEYDILVASDAIGMGLNLSIKRIIFHATKKSNGWMEVPVEIPQIKQIAGRAGRYRTAAQAVENDRPAVKEGARAEGPTVSSVVAPARSLGLVTTLHQGDLPVVRNAMESQADPIMTAGIHPPAEVLVRFAAYFPPSTPFSYILHSLHNTSTLHPRFHFCTLREQLKIADTIEPVKKLTVSDRITFCDSPASIRDEPLQPVIVAYAECVANNGGGGILDIKPLDLELLNTQVRIGSRDYLQKLELLHKALVLYLWLSYRFAGVFTTQEMAVYVKKIVEERIKQALSKGPIPIRSVSSTEPKDMSLEDIIDEPSEGGLPTALSRAPYRRVPGKSASGTVRHEIGGEPGSGIDVSILDLIPSRQTIRRVSVA